MIADVDAYREWFRKRQEELRSSPFTEADRVTAKSILFLAFLETEGKECNYEDLISSIVNHGVAERKNIQRGALRVGVRDLVKALEDTPFRIVRIGKGKFRLASSDSQFEPARQQARKIVASGKKIFMSIEFDHRLGRPDELVRNVMDDRVLPFHFLFYLPESAALWDKYSRDEEEQKTSAEADAWEKLQVNRVVADVEKDGVLSVVGLAVGHGQGEIGLLEKILEDEEVVEKKIQVHYLAVDLSPCLLLHHAQNLTMKFRKEISDGSLVCAAVLGDIFDLKEPSSKWNAIARSRGMISDDFLPWKSPMVVTYLGNCLGNGEMNSERIFLQLIRTRLGENREARRDAGTLRCLIGVSVNEKDPEEYSENLNDFLLLGLHRLANDEFTEGKDAFDPETAKPAKVEPVEFSGSFNLKGRRYVFEHVLQSRISSERGHVDKSSKIQLYAITKYDMETMVNFMRELGFKMTEKIDGDGTDDPGNFWIGKKIFPRSKSEDGEETESEKSEKSKKYRCYGIFCVAPTG